MEHIEDFSDERHKAWCIQCGKTLSSVQGASNKDHVPSQCMLDKEAPENLPEVRICRECNTGFSSDEEYFVAFLGSVISGNADPKGQALKRSERILASNRKLQQDIENSLTVQKDPSGNKRVVFIPNMERILRVIVKNARGHVYFEHGQPAFGEPDHATAVPLELLSEDQADAFLTVDHGNAWPEIGSRMMERLAVTAFWGNDPDFVDGWVIVQPGVYRYTVIDDGRFVVRIIMREYLAAQVIWERD
ncbi:hypothetical protein [Rhodovulum sp. 12E13]|uniref:hypothetical protein n=1 Tax=Rhodovulum sp. 12E13 TaxID=2203891 RepID=UPI0011C02130|nr:hypothetical protein [Rhodovulum sp. 12E13]